MSIEPLLTASAAIQFHVLAALLALGIGLGILLGPKGTVPHRVMGWLWALLMASIALSSFWIHELNILAGFSPIHLLSVATLAGLPVLILAARRHDLRRHRRMVYALYFAALVTAGLFTFMPGRIMYRVAFGG